MRVELNDRENFQIFYEKKHTENTTGTSRIQNDANVDFFVKSRNKDGATISRCTVFISKHSLLKTVVFIDKTVGQNIQSGIHDVNKYRLVVYMLLNMLSIEAE